VVLRGESILRFISQADLLPVNQYKLMSATSAFGTKLSDVIGGDRNLRQSHRSALLIDRLLRIAFLFE